MEPHSLLVPSAVDHSGEAPCPVAWQIVHAKRHPLPSRPPYASKSAFVLARPYWARVYRSGMRLSASQAFGVAPFGVQPPLQVPTNGCLSQCHRPARFPHAIHSFLPAISSV